jgi:hypothetical protein
MDLGWKMHFRSTVELQMYNICYNLFIVFLTNNIIDH